MFHKRLLKEFPENRKYVIGIVCCQWLSLLANVVFMYVTAQILYGVFQKQILPGDMIRYAVVFAVALIVRAISTIYAGKMSFAASDTVKVKLREKVYRKLAGLGAAYRKSVTTAEAVQISTEGVEQLEVYFGKYVPQFFYSLLAPLTLFFVVGSMSWKVAAVLFICVPLIPISIVAVQKFAKKLLNKYWGSYTELGDSFLENLQGLTTLKIFRADERYAEKMDEEAEKFRKVTMRVLIMQLNSISVMDLVAYGGAAVGIILSVLECQKGNIDLAECFFIMMISAEFFLPLRLLGSFFHIAMNGNAATNKIFRLLDVEEPQPGSVNELAADDILFEEVHFGYEEKEVLDDISFRIREKEFTALAGASGCGKSTIVSLIMGKEHAGAGKITIGGADISDITEACRNRKMTRISHDSYLFAGTVRENLLMGKADATEEEMLEALKKVDMLELVSFKGGLSMELTEKASNLSGGQKQRLALARALLHDSDIYLFDEATSNVDVESENRIMQIVAELAKEKTVIVISHRLANIVDADHILMMEHGKIVEEGTHDELVLNMGSYQKLYESQQKLEQFAIQN